MNRPFIEPKGMYDPGSVGCKQMAKEILDDYEEPLDWKWLHVFVMCLLCCIIAFCIGLKICGCL